MVGTYIIGGLVVFGLVALTFFKIKWRRADKAIAHIRADKIEKERIKTVAKTVARGIN